MLRRELGMAPAEDVKAHIDAVSRDYVCEPFLGEQQGARTTSGHRFRLELYSHTFIHFSRL